MPTAPSQEPTITRSTTAVAALTAGWIASFVPLALAVFISTPVRFFDIAAGMWIPTAILVFPSWLLLAVPLFIFLQPASDFWRYRIAIPFGTLFGIIIAGGALEAISADQQQSFSTVLSVALSGASSGATTLGLMAHHNTTIHKNPSP